MKTAIAVIGLFAGLAHAQEQPPEPAPAPLLSGPKIEEGLRPGAERFVESSGGENRMVPTAVRRRAFLRAMGTLRESTDPETRLSSEQRTQLESLLRRARVAAAAEGPKEGARAARKNDPASAEPMRPEEMTADPAVESWDDIQSSAWAVLNERQREAVQAELDRIRVELEARRDQEYEERQRREIQGQMAERRAGVEEIPTGRERLRTYLDRLPPERREEVARRLRERAARRAEERTGNIP